MLAEKSNKCFTGATALYDCLWPAYSTTFIIEGMLHFFSTGLRGEQIPRRRARGPGALRHRLIQHEAPTPETKCYSTNDFSLPLMNLHDLNMIRI